MAITGVMRPGHAQLRVLDLKESVDYYTNFLGLEETGRDKEGRVYLKAWDERDHNSVILREADSAGIDFYGFKVRKAEDLDKFENKLKDYGVTTERIPAGDMLETGERVRWQMPTGHIWELYHDKTVVGNGMGLTNPNSWREDTKGVAPVRMDHCLQYGGDIDGAHKLLVDVLDFSLVERVKLEDGETDLAIWLTCGHKAHDIAFVRHGEDNKLHHLSFLLNSWEEVLRAADLMSMYKVSIDIGPTRHGITRGTTIYFFDPSGNRLETFAGGYSTYPDYEAITWTWDEVGRGIFYHDRKLNEAFLSVVS